jgi:hypothetical protein
MVWYNPVSWFKSEDETAVPASTQPAPVGGPYGGKKRKSKTRRTKKAAKKTGRRKH